MVKEVAEAISAAHRHGIAHGRLLPENVMITESGSVKLIGFVVEAVLRGRESVRVTGGDHLGEHEADVVNLGALLYAGLVGRWPGTEGSTMPVAPEEHGRPLRPRQVRAGVPRPLDAICERVLGGGHAQTLPIETAHEVYAALSDYVGDPTGPEPLGEATGQLDSRALIAAGRGGGDGDAPGEETQLSALGAPGPDTAEAPAAAAVGRPESADRAATADPESTQVGAPVFDDAEADGTEATRVVPPPPPHLPEPEPRPLFASEQPRPTRPDAGRPRSTGVGAGAVPDGWGPDADTPPPVSRGAMPTTTTSRPGAAGCVWQPRSPACWCWCSRSSSPSTSAADRSSQRRRTDRLAEPVGQRGAAGAAAGRRGRGLRPRPASGGQRRGESRHASATSSTAAPRPTWRTLTYDRSAQFGNLKSGLGLVLDLGEPTEVNRVDLALVGSPTSLELYAAGDQAPTSIDGLEQVGASDGTGEQVRVALDEPARTRYLVVWLTSVPPVGGAQFRGEVAEIVVRS